MINLEKYKITEDILKINDIKSICVLEETFLDPIENEFKSKFPPLLIIKNMGSDIKEIKGESEIINYLNEIKSAALN